MYCKSKEINLRKHKIYTQLLTVEAQDCTDELNNVLGKIADINGQSKNETQINIEKTTIRTDSHVKKNNGGRMN